jgi:hypothetical protein
MSIYKDIKQALKKRPLSTTRKIVLYPFVIVAVFLMAVALMIFDWDTQSFKDVFEEFV